MTDVIVPVKDLLLAKSRLSGVLSQDERGKLVCAMLRDQLANLKQSNVKNIWLVARDHEVLKVGKQFNVGLVTEAHSTGYNKAVLRGLACVSIDSPVLVLPADLPLLQASDVNNLISSCNFSEPTVGIVPDRRWQGTNALYLSKPYLIETKFGHNSLLEHKSAAALIGVTTQTITVQNLSLDIDTSDDLRLYLETRRAGATLNFLRSISFGKSHQHMELL